LGNFVPHFACAFCVSVLASSYLQFWLIINCEFHKSTLSIAEPNPTATFYGGFFENIEQMLGWEWFGKWEFSEDFLLWYRNMNLVLGW
jgi:hypothetical protein